MVVFRVQANVHHVGPMVSLMAQQVSQLNITMQGIQLISTIEVIGLSVIQITIAAWSLWASKRRVHDFHCSCECSVCDPRGAKKYPWCPRWSALRF